MWVIHSWWDFWRLLNLLVNVLCIVWLIGGYKRQNTEWNSKSLEMWYSRLIWAVTGIALSFEGIQHHRTWSWTLGFVTIAGLSSFSALRRRGEWGYVPEK